MTESKLRAASEKRNSDINAQLRALYAAYRANPSTHLANKIESLRLLSLARKGN